MNRVWLAGLLVLAGAAARADDWTPPPLAADASKVPAAKGKRVRNHPYSQLPKTGCASKSGLFRDNDFAELGPLAGCQAAGAASVLDRVIRGGAPTAEGMRCLKQLGVTAIVDLRGKGEGSQAQEEQLAAQLGMAYFNRPMNASGGIPGVTGCRLLKPAEVKQNSDSAAAADADITAQLAASPSGKVYVHCMHGQDRTGLTLGLRRRKGDQCSKDQVRDEMDSYWYTPYCALDKVWQAAP